MIFGARYPSGFKLLGQMSGRPQNHPQRSILSSEISIQLIKCYEHFPHVSIIVWFTMKLYLEQIISSQAKCQNNQHNLSNIFSQCIQHKQIWKWPKRNISTYVYKKTILRDSSALSLHFRSPFKQFLFISDHVVWKYKEHGRHPDWIPMCWSCQNGWVKVRTPPWPQNRSELAHKSKFDNHTYGKI